mgnify:CR=1 FL=1
MDWCDEKRKKGLLDSFADVVYDDEAPGDQAEDVAEAAADVLRDDVLWGAGLVAGLLVEGDMSGSTRFAAGPAVVA